MTFTREDIIKHLNNEAAAGRLTMMARGLFINKVLNEMKTISELKLTTRDQFVRSHDRISKATLAVWDEVVQWMYALEKEEKQIQQAEQDAIIAENRIKAEQAKHEAEINPWFTNEQIKSLSAMMDLCGWEKINLRKINEFIGAIVLKGEHNAVANAS